MQTRLFQAGFCLWVLGVSASRKSRAHAPDCAHVASLPDYRQPINPTGRNACRRGCVCLDDTPRSAVFFESEQSKNKAGEMVPLYAARVQDLGTGDFVVIKCGACGHTTEIPPSGLIGGLRRDRREIGGATAVGYFRARSLTEGGYVA